MSEQAEATQNTSSDDQHHQSDKQPRGGSRNTPSMAGDRWLWQKWHICRHPRGRSRWWDDLVWCGSYLSSLAGWCGEVLWRARGAWWYGELGGWCLGRRWGVLGWRAGWTGRDTGRRGGWGR